MDKRAGSAQEREPDFDSDLATFQAGGARVTSLETKTMNVEECW
jgi:hypothetical protein